MHAYADVHMCRCTYVCTHTHLVYAHVRYIFPLERRSTVWLPIGEAAGRWSSEHGSARNHLSILRTIQVQSDMQLTFGCRSSVLARVGQCRNHQSFEAPTNFEAVGRWSSEQHSSACNHFDIPPAEWYAFDDRQHEWQSGTSPIRERVSNPQQGDACSFSSVLYTTGGLYITGRRSLVCQLIKFDDHTSAVSIAHPASHRTLPG